MKLSNYILNTMFAAMLLIPASLTAQNKTFENLAKKENVEYVYIPQSMLKSMDGMQFNGSINLSQAVNKLKSVEVLACLDPVTIEMIIPALKEDADKMETLSKVIDEGDSVEIYAVRNGERFSELYIINVTRSDTDKHELSAIYITGDFSADDLKNL